MALLGHPRRAVAHLGKPRWAMLLWASPMDMTQRLALSQRLEWVEAGLQEAVRSLDGSPAARTRYYLAQVEHRDVTRATHAVLRAVAGEVAEALGVRCCTCQRLAGGSWSRACAVGPAPSSRYQRGIWLR